MEWMEIFRAGKRADANGNSVEITRDDLEKMAQNYHIETHEAPIVVGHPKDNAPAFGWIKALRVVGDVLEALPGEIEPQFLQMVREGRFKKISASFYLPQSRANPKPDGFYLRHVGFLGAMPPAVKGLADPVFRETVTEYAFIESDFFKEQSMTKEVSQYAENTQPESALLPENPESAEKLADALAELAELKAELEEAKAKIQALKDEAERAKEEALQQELTAEENENAAFCEALIEKGVLIPAMKDNALRLLNIASRQNRGQVVEFGEGEDLRVLVCQLLNALPESVVFGEVAQAKKVSKLAFDSVAYRESDDPNRIELDKKARAYMKAKGVDYVTALNAVE